MSSFAGVKNDARSIAAATGMLGPGGTAIHAAAADFQQAADLKAARAAFARLGDAIMIYAKESGPRVGDDVKIAYCPMVQKYWLQKGEPIQNLRHEMSTAPPQLTLPVLKK